MIISSRGKSDRLLEGGVIYECKATGSITSKHKQQLLQYLFLSNLQHGRLINFRLLRVEGWFLNNGTTFSQRRSPKFHEEGAFCFSGALALKKTLQQVLLDCGTGLAASTYLKALVVLLGPKQIREKAHMLQDHGRELEACHWYTFSDGTILMVSTHRNQLEGFRMHKARILRLCEAPGICWINISLHDVHLIHMTS